MHCCQLVLADEKIRPKPSFHYLNRHSLAKKKVHFPHISNVIMNSARLDNEFNAIICHQLTDMFSGVAVKVSLMMFSLQKSMLFDLFNHSVSDINYIY